MVAGTELQTLGSGQFLVEAGVLVGREDRVAPGVGHEDGRTVLVELVDIGLGRTSPPPGDHLLLLREVRGEEALQGLPEFGAGAAGESADAAEQGGGLGVLGAARVDRVDEIGPAAERGDRLDPFVVLGGQQADPGTVRDADHADPPRVGGGVGECPVDHLRGVGDVGRARHFYLAAGLPEAADVVTDHHIAGVGEFLGLCEVLDLGQTPARGQHDERVGAGAVGVRGGDDVALEDRAAVPGDVDEADAARGRLGGGSEPEGAAGDQGRRDGTHGGRAQGMAMESHGPLLTRVGGK